eukprot:g17638.t1
MRKVPKKQPGIAELRIESEERESGSQEYEDGLPGLSPADFFRRHVAENEPLLLRGFLRPAVVASVSAKLRPERLRRAYGDRTITAAPQQLGKPDKWLEAGEEWGISKTNTKANAKVQKVLAVAARRVELTLAEFLDSLPRFYADGAGCLDTGFQFLKGDLEEATRQLEKLVPTVWGAGKAGAAGNLKASFSCSRDLGGGAECGGSTNTSSPAGSRSREADLSSVSASSSSGIAKTGEIVRNYATFDVEKPATDGERERAERIREAEVEVVLEPGDLLYIPVGWWHEVEALPAPAQELNFSYTSFFHPFFVRLKGRSPQTALKSSETAAAVVGGNGGVAAESASDSTDQEEESLEVDDVLQSWALNPRYRHLHHFLAQHEEGSKKTDRASREDPDNSPSSGDSGTSSDSDTAGSSSSKERRKQIMKFAEQLLDEHYVSGVVKLGSLRFIEKKLADPACADVARLRRWFLLRLNKRAWQHGIQDRAVCADNVPVTQNFAVWPENRLLENSSALQFLDELSSSSACADDT